MRFLQLIIMLAMLAGGVFTTPSFAQDQAQAVAQTKVAARTGSHKGYVRLVFDWPAKPEYSIAKDGDVVKLRFSRAATLDQAGVSASDSNIRKLETLSSASEPLQVAVTIPSGSRFRDFIVGNKLILDVYDAEGAKETQPTPAEKTVEKPVEKPAEKTAEKPVAAVTPPAAKSEAPAKADAVTTPPAPATEVVKEEAASKGDFSIRPAESANRAPLTDVEATKVEAPKLAPHAITFTSTTANGMAVFKRNDMLWLLIDAIDLPSAPQVTGPQKDRLPPLEKVQLPDATAYYMDIPDGMNVYADGGGLSWRIELTPDARKTTPVIPSSEEGKLVWPMKDMRKVITFVDPMVGDTITAVTAPRAAQYAGTPREFVQLSTLDSVVGLAFIAKADDLKTEKTFEAVRVGRPDGLILSSNRDLMPEQIRRQMEDEPKPEAETKTEQAKDDLELKEAPPAVDPEHLAEAKKLEAEEPAVKVEELAKAAEEKPEGNNIFNLSRWEMGGPASLSRNMHALMMELSAKGGDVGTEDVLTMAKLNVANDRGAEALGLLRMALTKVPELEDNAEFNALRGAATALAYKYDEAILDFSREGVKKFNDVKYWTAYALAGLEDWKQAIAVLPQNLDMVATYPMGIRMPMVLTFAEVALRGGNVQQALGILDILRPDLATLPLPYASYWNYLAGEAARQGGQPDKAIEYWEPLVKDGKDDLFRAKAGLSLTKLLLDQKKIKPADAINTLEGLRYAWRGDELEALINLRLGQVYIDNNDYLKGLTVLRNASSLSPGSDINRETRNYMASTFRDIFNNDRIRNVSPLEAIGLYEEFKDLAPPGDESDRYVEKLAERLVEAELLGRAASLLEYQVNNRLQGDKKAEIAVRLSAIRLLDGNPDGALRSLEIAQDALDKLSGAKPDPAAAAAATEDSKTDASKTEAPKAAAKADPEKQRQVYLLKARAHSMKKETDKAIEILEAMRPDADVNRLRTDISWTAGRWEEAALALNDLLSAEDISARRPLTDYQRDLVLNRAIALNLSGNRVALANLRERYNAQMKDTTKGQMFEIVTRPRRPDMIGSRQAIDSMISEIDLFQGFVDGYAKMESRGQQPATQTPAAQTPAPAAGATPDATLSTTQLPDTTSNTAD